MDGEKIPAEWQVLYRELVDAVMRAAEATNNPRLSKEEVERITNSLEVLNNLVREFISITRDQLEAPAFHDQMGENLQLFREKMKRQTDLIDSIIEKAETR